MAANNVKDESCKKILNLTGSQKIRNEYKNEDEATKTATVLKWRCVSEQWANKIEIRVKDKNDRTLKK